MNASFPAIEVFCPTPKAARRTENTIFIGSTLEDNLGYSSGISTALFFRQFQCSVIVMADTSSYTTCMKFGFVQDTYLNLAVYFIFLFLCVLAQASALMSSIGNKLIGGKAAHTNRI